MRIGEVAERAGVTAKTVRHYEALGLIRAGRQPNGYRDYDDESPRLVAEARLLSGLGIRLERTRPFLRCLRDGNVRSDDCRDSVEAYRRAIADLSEQIDELQDRRSALTALMLEADARSAPRCQYASGAEHVNDTTKGGDRDGDRA